MNLESRHFLSKVLAAAVCDLAPKAQLVNARASRYGFYADFILPEPIASSQVKYIKKRMEELLRLETIEKLDMMAEILAQCLKEHNQIVRAHFARERRGELLSVIKIGPFFDYSDEPFDPAQEGLSFELNDLSECAPLLFRGHEERVIRFSGSLLGEVKRLDHVELGKTLFSLFPERPTSFETKVDIYWHPDGMRLREQLKAFWQREVQKAGFCVVESLRGLEAYLEKFPDRKRVAQFTSEASENFSCALLEPAYAMNDHLFCVAQNDETTFLLQFIVKTINILGLKWKPYLVRSLLRKNAKGEAEYEDKLRRAAEALGLECELEFRKGERKGGYFEIKCPDAFGREWTVASFILYQEKRFFHYKIALFTSIERVMALLLEQRQKPLLGIGVETE